MLYGVSSGVVHSSGELVRESSSRDVCGLENDDINGSFGERDSGRPGVFGRVFCAVFGANGAMAARAAEGVEVRDVCIRLLCGVSVVLLCSGYLMLYCVIG